MTADEINKLAEEAPTRDTIRTVIRYVLDGQGVAEGLIRNAVANVDGVLDMLDATPPAQPVAAKPAVSQAGLTDERIDVMWCDATSPKSGGIGHMATYLAARQFARAIESALRSEGQAT